MSLPVNSASGQFITDEAKVYNAVVKEFNSEPGKSVLTNSPIIRKLMLAYNVDPEVFENCTSCLCNINNDLSLMFIRGVSKSDYAKFHDYVDVCKFNNTYIAIVFVDKAIAEVPSVDTDLKSQVGKTYCMSAKIFNTIFSILHRSDPVLERDTMIDILDNNIDMICATKFTLEVFNRIEFTTWLNEDCFRYDEDLHGYPAPKGMFYEDSALIRNVFGKVDTETGHYHINKELIECIQKLSILSITDDYALNSLLASN